MIESILAYTVAGLVVLTGFLLLRFRWLKVGAGAGQAFPPVLFCLWIVSVVVWNAYFWSGRVGGLVDISIDRALFTVLAVTSLIQILRRKIDMRANHSLEWAMAVFLCVCLVSMSINGFAAVSPEYPKPWFTFYAGYVIPFFAFIYAKYFLRDESSVRMVMTTLFLLGFYLAVTAIFERFGPKELVLPAFILDPKVTLHLDRARGPFQNSAFNGLAMAMGFIGGLYLLPKALPGARFAIISALVLYLPGVFLTYTRSVYLGFVLIMAALLFFFRSELPKRKLVPLVLLACMIAAAVNSERLLSDTRTGGGIAQVKEVTIRFELIKRSIRLFTERPLFGVGLAHFTAAEGNPEIFQEQQHNHLIGMAVELGTIGFVSYALILVLVFRRLLALTRNAVNDTIAGANLILVLALGFTVNLLTNVFIEPSFVPFATTTTYLFAGLIDRMHEDQGRLPEASSV